jgi:biotin operon repressor
MKTLLLTAASVTAALTLALSGCSSDSQTGPSGESVGDSPPKGEADPFAKVVTYAECLQKQGLQVKIKPGDGFTMPKSTDPKKREAAEAACRSVAPPGMYAKPSAEELDRDVKIAQCLRAQGIKVQDPTEDKPQLRISFPPANLRQLEDACEKKIGGGSGGN